MLVACTLKTRRLQCHRTHRQGMDGQQNRQ